MWVELRYITGWQFLGQNLAPSIKQDSRMNLLLLDTVLSYFLLKSVKVLFCTASYKKLCNVSLAGREILNEWCLLSNSLTKQERSICLKKLSKFINIMSTQARKTEMKFCYNHVVSFIKNPNGRIEESYQRKNYLTVLILLRMEWQ